MTKKGWFERDGKRMLFDLGLTLNILTLMLIFVSFCSPYWIQSWPRVYSPFKRIGLWEVCLSGLILEADPRQKGYHGCWWILSSEFNGIRSWLTPSWFIWTQVAVSLCFVTHMVNVIMMFCIWFHTGKTQRDPKASRRRDPYLFINISTIMTTSCAVVMTVTLIMFGIMFKFDRYWLPNPTLNWLSWSYGIAIVSTFFDIFASIAKLIHLKIVKEDMRKPPTADPMYPVTVPLMKSSRENVARSQESLNKPKQGGGGGTGKSGGSKENVTRSQEQLHLLPSDNLYV